MVIARTVHDALPATVTFLATGVDSSTLLGDLTLAAVPAALARHHELVGAGVREHGAARWARSGDGDGVLAEFTSSAHAVAAALAIQRALGAEEWPDGLPVRVRIGLCTGEDRSSDGRDRTAAIAQRCARLRDVAHGGQTLLSSATASLAAETLPAGAWLADLGVHRLRSLDALPNNLPPQLTSFVGRKDELAQIRRLLASHRLLTLAGAGGCGKTR